MTRLGVLEQLDRPAATAEPDETWLDGLDEALDELPEGQRAAIELRVVDDLSYEAVGDALGTTSTRRARPRPSRAARAALAAHERNGGDTVNDLTPELTGLGDALERAAAADLAARAARAAGAAARGRGGRSRVIARAGHRASRPTS